jgi:hypothetical protein
MQTYSPSDVHDALETGVCLPYKVIVALLVSTAAFGIVRSAAITLMWSHKGKQRKRGEGKGVRNIFQGEKGS